MTEARILAMFPGQGSQYVGMGSKLVKEFPKCKQVFEQADDAISFDIQKLCFEGPESELILTANTQPAILTVSTVIWMILKEEFGFKPHCFAGHSLGEYSALVASDKLDFSDAVRLVRARGQAMQEAVPTGVGAMAAVMNCDAKDLEEICGQISQGECQVQIANYNSPQQLVIAGHKKAVDQTCLVLKEKNIRYVELAVSAPFHSRLMQPAKEKMAPLLEDTQFLQNDNTIIPNLTGKSEVQYSYGRLVEQIDSPVLWIQTLKEALALGCNTFVEIGPGKVLFGLARRSVPKGLKLVHTETLPEFSVQ